MTAPSDANADSDADAFGFLQAPTGRYLGDPTVVNALVREFVAGVLNLRARWNETGEDPTAQIEAEARRCGDIVLGRDPSFTKQPYNARHRLGVVIGQAIDVKAGDDPGYALFEFLAREALGCSISMESGEDPEKVGQALDKLIGRAINLVLGVGVPQ